MEAEVLKARINSHMERHADLTHRERDAVEFGVAMTLMEMGRLELAQDYINIMKRKLRKDYYK